MAYRHGRAAPRNGVPTLMMLVFFCRFWTELSNPRLRVGWVFFLRNEGLLNQFTCFGWVSLMRL